MKTIGAKELRTNLNQILDQVANGDEIFISTLTAHLVTYFGKSIVELPVLRAFLADYTLLSLEANDFEWAFTNARDSDFEDALQLAVAIRNGCEEFVTFDKHLAELYKDLIQIKVRLLGQGSSLDH